jgi:hypothetical protein
MYLNRDMDGRPFLVYFLPILGRQKAAVSDSAEGWCAAPGLFPSHSWWATSCNISFPFLVGRKLQCST